MPINIDNKKKFSDKNNSEKKYDEIKSMEELFLEDEEDKNMNYQDLENNINNNLEDELENVIEYAKDKYNINNNLNKINNKFDRYENCDENLEEIYIHDNEELNLPNIHLSYEEEILNSFENLNLEDFKNLSNQNKSNNKNKNNNEINIDIPIENFKIGKKLKIPGIDHPVLDQINEFILKSVSSQSSGGNLQELGIKIEDYENNLENDYNYNYTQTEEENTINENCIKENKFKTLPTGNKYNSNINTNNIPKPNINNILKNKNKFKPLIKKMNNTFSMTERLNSPYTRNKTDQNNSPSRFTQNLSGHDIENINTKFNKINHKNIHNLLNIHKKNNTAINEENNPSEFRKILKSKLTKNSDKIFANLKRLSDYNHSTIQTGRDYYGRDTSVNMMRGRSNEEGVINRNRSKNEVKLNLNLDHDDEDYEYNNQNSIMKKNNYLINTNLTESKYLVSSSGNTKTPSFNNK